MTVLELHPPAGIPERQAKEVAAEKTIPVAKETGRAENPAVAAVLEEQAEPALKCRAAIKA